MRLPAFEFRVQDEPSAIDDIMDEIPSTADQIGATLLESIGSIWAQFLGQIPLLIAGMIVLLVTWGIVAVARRVADKAFRRSRMRTSLRELFVRLVSIAIWVLGLLLAAMIIFPGLTPAKALGGLGLLSVAIGFAFKDIFENFFAGIILLWKFPFENGDFIECQDIMGKVEDIHIRMTEIRKTTGELVVVPNAFLFNNPVDVLTDKPVRRVTIITGVAYGEDVAQCVSVIQKAVESCESVSKQRDVEIFPQGFGASSVDIETTWWAAPTPLDIRRSRGEVVTAVKKALDDAGIEIPFPYRTLTFKEPLQTHMLGGREAEQAPDTA